MLANLTSSPFLDVTDSLNASKIDDSRKLWVLPMTMRIIAHWPLIFSNILLVLEDGFPIYAYNLISIAFTVTSCSALVTAVSTSYASIISSRWNPCKCFEWVCTPSITYVQAATSHHNDNRALSSFFHPFELEWSCRQFRLKLVQPCTALNDPKMKGLLESWEFLKVFLPVKT